MVRKNGYIPVMCSGVQYSLDVWIHRRLVVLRGSEEGFWGGGTALGCSWQMLLLLLDLSDSQHQ